MKPRDRRASLHDEDNCPMAKKQPKQKSAPKPGPKPDTLTVKGDWQDAVKKSFQKKKPPGGWPQ
jgi:hypothetical protein